MTRRIVTRREKRAWKRNRPVPIVVKGMVTMAKRTKEGLRWSGGILRYANRLQRKRATWRSQIEALASGAYLAEFKGVKFVWCPKMDTAALYPSPEST